MDTLLKQVLKQPYLKLISVMYLLPVSIRLSTYTIICKLSMFLNCNLCSYSISTLQKKKIIYKENIYLTEYIKKILKGTDLL